MGWSSPDVYNQPEKFGLEIVFSTDEGSSYEFAVFVVCEDASGQLYYATDAGCSCSSPFEYCTSVDDLTPGSREDIIAAMNNWSRSTEETKADLSQALYA